MSSTEQPTAWVKASASDQNGSCVQMRRNGATIQVRDSKLGDSSPILSFTNDEVVAWMDGVTKEEFTHLVD